MNTDQGENLSFLPGSRTTQHSRVMKHPDVAFYLRKRYFVCFWTCVGYTMLLILNSNLIIATVELTSEKNVTTENGTIVKKAEVEWDSKMKGFLFSIFSVGFLVSPFGGMLASKFGGVRIYGLGLFVAAVLTILTKFVIRYSFSYLVLVRFLMGVFESLACTSFLNIFTRWAPPHERSRLIAFAFIGFYVGTFISFSLGGFLAQNYGVDSVFIITGVIGIAWYIIWILSVSNDPSSDSFITQKECKYFGNFAHHQIENTKLSDFPWKSMLKSKPVWAIFNEYFCFSWVNTFIFMYLPLYIKDSFNVDIESIGYISSIPILGNLAGVVFFSILADYLRTNEILKIANVHKLFAAIGQLSCAVFLLVICFWANFTQSVILFTVMRFISGSAEITYQVVFIDLFAEYSGTIRGIASLFCPLAGFLASTVLGYVVTDHSRESWNLFFAIISVFNIFGLVIFFIFGSGELQEWAVPKVADKPKKSSA